MAREIVPFDGAESAYRSRVALLKEAQPDEPWSVEGEQGCDRADAAAGRATASFFAVVDGARVGFARFRADPEDSTPGRRRLWLVVARAARRRGLGSALLDAVGEAAAGRGVTEFLVSTRLSERDGLAFALARGFIEVDGEIELHLDLVDWEPGRFSASVAPGLRLASLASLAGSRRGWLEAYYRLYCAVGTGVLWERELSAPAREVFAEVHLEAPELLGEGTMVALLGEEWVGLCELRRSGGDAVTVYQELTGVLPARRRLGIGRGLVAAAADWARGRGYRRLLTSTGVGNRAMQALAGRLGFRAVARWSYLVGPVPGPSVGSGEEVAP